MDPQFPNARRRRSAAPTARPPPAPAGRARRVRSPPAEAPRGGAKAGASSSLRPLLWIGIIVVIVVIAIVLNFIPILGNIAQALLWPVFIGGVLLGCHALAQGRPLEFSHLFAGFQDGRAGPLVILGADRVRREPRVRAGDHDARVRRDGLLGHGRAA